MRRYVIRQKMIQGPGELSEAGRNFAILSSCEAPTTNCRLIPNYKEPLRIKEYSLQPLTSQDWIIFVCLNSMYKVTGSILE